jgi:transcriptional regulator with XRE-family HTH domain
MTQTEPRRIPADSFRNRLAMVRTEMGWNYDQAEAATGVGSESWRLWERGLRRCTDVIGVSRKIAEATGFDQGWLALGGPLSMELESPHPPRARRPKTADDVISDPDNSNVPGGNTHESAAHAPRGITARYLAAGAPIVTWRHVRL